ncbi:unnamed protein product [Nesidiocoris tenuis]|uniref:Uncharacterized protein n=1 Tax=Nesidiocoris tenuis TaxID=355587 RepID=A0A6H5GAS1_9HEMI|nr:unnamed protein product [Nesidiocoris tenuis]
MDINLTAIAFLSTFLLSALHLGSPTTSGVVVPNLVMGALWGRILERVLANSLYMEYVKGPRAGPGPLGPRAPGILPPLPPPLDGPGSFTCDRNSEVSRGYLFKNVPCCCCIYFHGERTFRKRDKGMTALRKRRRESGETKAEEEGEEKKKKEKEAKDKKEEDPDDENEMEGGRMRRREGGG